MRPATRPPSPLALTAVIARAAARGASARATTRAIAVCLAEHLPLRAVELGWLIGDAEGAVVHARLDDAGGATLAVERRPLGDSFAEAAVTRGEALLLRTEVDGEAEHERAIAAHVGAGWFLVLPLASSRFEDAPVGFANLFLAAEGRARPVLDDELVATVGRLLAGAVERVSMVSRVAGRSRAAHQRLRAANAACGAARAEAEAVRRRADEIEASSRRARSRELEQALQLRAERGRVEALEAAAAEAEAELARLRAVAAERDRLQAAVEEAQSELGRLQRDAELARAAAARASAEVARLEGEVGRAHADLERARAAPEAGEAEIGPLRVALESARAEEARLRVANERQTRAEAASKSALEARVAELERALEAAAGSGARGPAVAGGPDESPDGAAAIATFDDASREAIARALRATRGRVYGVGGAAELLALSPSTLQSKMAKLGMRRETFL